MITTSTMIHLDERPVLFGSSRVGAETVAIRIGDDRDDRRLVLFVSNPDVLRELAETCLVAADAIEAGLAVQVGDPV